MKEIAIREVESSELGKVVDEELAIESGMRDRYHIQDRIK